MFKNYLKIAVRNMLKFKAWSFINLSGLAVGMAVCILVLLFVQDEISYDKYHEKADRIFRVAQGGEDFLNANTVFPMAPAMKAEFHEIENAVRLRKMEGVLVNYQNKYFVEDRLFFADSTVFEIFSFPLLQGDPKTALIEPNTVVLTEEMARKYFAAENPVGKILTADLYNDGKSADLKITGVLKNIPHNSHFHFDFLVSFATQTDISDNWNNYQSLYTYLLLPEAASTNSLQARLPDFIKKYYPKWEDGRYVLQPLTDIHLRSQLGAEIEANSDIAYVYILSLIAVFILLLACVNFTNLTIARSTSRAKEVGMRKVSGALQGQLIKQFLIEAIALSFLALLFAILLAELFLPIFNALSGKTLQIDYFDNWLLLAGFATIALMVGLIAGSYPAFFLAGYRPVEVLKGKTPVFRQVYLRKALVIFQFAISISLIISTGLVYDQLDYIRNKPLGFEKEQVLAIPLSSAAKQHEAALKNDILQHPAITNASLSERVPTIEGDRMAVFLPEDKDQMALPVYFVDHDFVETFQLKVLAGRAFSSEMAGDAAQAFVLNEAAVKRIGWSSPEEALGKKFTIWRRYEGRIIGVVEDFHAHSLHESIEPLVMAMGPVKGDNYISIRLQSAQLSEILGFLQEKWQIYSPNHPFDYFFIDDNFARLHDADQQAGRVFGFAALLAIFIACLGLFGLASFTIKQRTKEVGIRKVIGATVLNVIALLSNDFLKLVLLANFIAWPVAWFAMNKWLENFAYRISIDWWVFLLGGGLALLIALLTVSTQAIRAALANPVDSLRYE